MRAITLTTSDASGATKNSNVAPMDTYKNPFVVGFNAVVTGTATYTVQHTYDDPFAASFTAAGATWINHANVASLTASADGNYNIPVRAIRLQQTAGTGSVALTLVQAG